MVRRCSSCAPQLGAQVVVLAARGAASSCSRSSLSASAVLQAGLRGAVVQARRARASAARRHAGCWPPAAAAVSMRALQLGAARRERARLRTAPPAPAARARAAARARRPARARRRSRASSSSAWRSCASASCMSSSSKRASPAALALAAAPRAGASISASSSSSCARRARGWLRPAASGAAVSTCSWCALRLRLGRFAARRDQALRRHRCRRPRRAPAPTARLVGDQRLRAQLALEVLDFLRARQHAGLLGIGRVEAHRVLR